MSSARRSWYKESGGSHVTATEIAARLISPLEACGNEVADKLAERSALRNAVSREFVAGIRQTDLRVRLVQTKLIEANLLHVPNKPKIVRAAAKPPARRAKFDPASVMVHRMQFGQGRHTIKCRRCLIRGHRLFLKRLPMHSQCFQFPVWHVALPAHVPAHRASSQLVEPESIFIVDTLFSEDGPFCWGGDVDEEHLIMSDQ